MTSFRAGTDFWLKTAATLSDISRSGRSAGASFGNGKKSTCADDFAKKWPPVLATPGSPLTVEGVPQEAVGTMNRPDGSIQLTLGGWPVYRFAGDTQPGATTGQGVNGTWAAVTPDGKKAGASG